MFSPKFQVTGSCAKALMEIEGHRQAVDSLPFDPKMLASLRESSRLQSTHYSTQIEGNRLSEKEVHEALAGAHVPGRERDEDEVKNYYRALEEMEKIALQKEPVTEKTIRTLHGVVMDGKIRPTTYRDGQNVIRDGISGRIAYLPPESKDVPSLMAEFVLWLNGNLKSRALPMPVVAAIAHYQFATIHPYYDGNGRTARLLTTLILHKTGYGLKGIYSLEEYYAKELPLYYRSLDVGPSHNYYEGRSESDISSFVEYFCVGMAVSFSKVRAQADHAKTRGAVDLTPRLRELDPKKRRLLDLFKDRGIVTSNEIAQHLDFSPRTVGDFCRKWVKEGFLEIVDPSNKARSYRLGKQFEKELI